MGHRSFCDSRFWRIAWLPFASAQKVGCVLCVYRVAAWRDCVNDAYIQRSRIELLRGLDGCSDAAGSDGVFDLVFEANREQGMDQLGTVSANRYVTS